MGVSLWLQLITLSIKNIRCTDPGLRLNQPGLHVTDSPMSETDPVRPGTDSPRSETDPPMPEKLLGSSCVTPFSYIVSCPDLHTL